MQVALAIRKQKICAGGDMGEGFQITKTRGNSNFYPNNVIDSSKEVTRTKDKQWSSVHKG